MHSTTGEAIHAFTDGTCSGNPGPAGIGVVLVCGAHRREVSESIANATSNIAKLQAVILALSLIQDRDRPVVVYCDCDYATGVLTKRWKIRSNQDLIDSARRLAARYSRLSFNSTPAFTDLHERRRCGVLARAALDKR